MMNPNLEILETAVHLLGPLADRMVFLGGCAAGLLITDPGALTPRVTHDVDVIVEVASLVAYHKLSQKLKKQGFSEDIGPYAPLCRWKARGVVLDVMPTDPNIMGFGNQWYAPAFRAAKPIALPSGKAIRILPAPYFLATKLEAFDNRGAGDFLLSKDMEDLITVLDGRLEIVAEVKHADDKLRGYLAERFFELLRSRRFIDALPGHLPPDNASQARLPLLIERLRLISV